MTKLFDDTVEQETPVVEIPDDIPLKPFLERYHDDKGIAKAIVEKDNFIATLKKENADLRAENLSRQRVEETVDRLLASKNTPPVTEVVTDPTGKTAELPQTNATGLTQEQVMRILEDNENKKREATNVAETQRLLKESFGPEWQKMLIERGKALGETKEFFDSLARRNPQAVLALLGGEKKAAPAAQPTLFAGGVNTTQQSLNTQSGVRNKSYYDKLRKDMNVKILPNHIQVQMHADALKLGEAFFQ